MTDQREPRHGSGDNAGSTLLSAGDQHGLAVADDAIAGDDETMVVRLLGGPADLPADARIRRVSIHETKVKLEHCGGYEHFERMTQPDGATSGLAGTFGWTTRTRIAE
jgi:hypothetical protein